MERVLPVRGRACADRISTSGNASEKIGATSIHYRKRENVARSGA
jgi:hypothetical protein